MMIRWPDGESQVGNFAMIFDDHSESGPPFNVSSEGRHLLQHSVPITALGRWDLIVTTGGKTASYWPTNTSSSSNLVFTGGLPSRYWPSPNLLSRHIVVEISVYGI